MTAWIATTWASKLGRPLMIGGGVLLLLGLVFLLGRCTGGDDTDAIKAQADQTNLSSDAIADAAEGAIETLEGRVATEDAIDQATQAALTEIDGAASPSQIEIAVRSALCAKPSHQNDPACMPTAENHR